MKKKTKNAVLVSTTVAALYFASYLTLSLNGLYEPADLGLGEQGLGVKSYRWSPYGFGAPVGRVRSACLFPYYPLYFLDLRFWHTHCKTVPQGYPERVLSREELERL